MVTIYVPTLVQFQKYTEPYFESIQYAGSEDIIKALHGFIEGIVSNDIINMQMYFNNKSQCDDHENFEYFEKMNITEEDNDSIVIQKICNFVKTENDFKIVSNLSGLEYANYEVSAYFKVQKIELV